MGLWDALSGKIYHWNAVKVEVHREIYPRLKMLSSDMTEFKQVIFAHYVGFFYLLTEMAFNDESDFRAWNLSSRLKQLNKDAIISIISIILSDLLISLLAAVDDESRENGRDWLIYTCAIFGRDRSFTEEKVRLYDLADATSSAQIMKKDLSLVLGLDPASEWDLQPWLHLRAWVPRIAPEYGNLPDWEELMNKELARPPRIGGYPDQLA
jgi:hypothetical protein